MIALFATVFLASLVGSLHCAGMCGGLVAFAVGSDDSQGRARIPGHVAWHAGRLLTYAVLGAVAGGIGSAVDLAGSAVGLQRSAAVVAGACMVAWGLVALLRACGVPLTGLVRGRLLQAVFSRATRQLHRHPPVVRAAVLGLATGLLPCGWLYAFVVTAAGTASPVWGALAMIAFWAGTLPLLVALGVGVQQLAGPLRRHLPTASALALVVVGLLAVSGRVGAHHAAPGTANAAGSAAGGDCCHGR